MAKDPDAELAALRRKLQKKAGEHLRNHPENRPQSGTPGITWHSPSGKWQVHVWTGGRGSHLGLFATLGAAEKRLADFHNGVPTQAATD